jgi:hypothetical protein
MPLSSTSTSTAKDHQYFTKSCKIFNAYATFTDVLFCQYISSGIFFLARFFRLYDCRCLIFLPTELATKREITDDLNADR